MVSAAAGRGPCRWCWSALIALAGLVARPDLRRPAAHRAGRRRRRRRRSRVGVAARRLPSWPVAPLSVLALAGVRAARDADRRRPGRARRSRSRDARRRRRAQRHPAPAHRDDPGRADAGHGARAGGRGLAGRAGRRRAGAALGPACSLGYGPPTLLYAGALYVVGPNADPAARWPTLVVRRGSPRPGWRLTGRRRRGTRRACPPARATCAARAGRGGRRAGASWSRWSPCVGPLVAGRVDADAGRPAPVRRSRRSVDSLDENPLIRISGWALNPDAAPAST